MPTDRVRVGVIGCGDIAFRRYLPGFETIRDQAEVVALYDRDTARMTAAVAQYGGRTYDSLEALLGAPDVDAVLNLTPPRYHTPVNLAALRAGKHLMTEKPLAGTLEEADTLIAEARERRLLLVCAPAIAMDAFTVDLRTLIQGGAIGTVTHARAQLCTFGPAAWREYTSDPTWFYEEGAGPLVDLGVYMLHVLTELLGPARRVTALAGIGVPQRTVLAGPAKGKEITVRTDDNVQTLLEFAGSNGRPAFAHLDSSYCSWATPGPMIELYGSEGVLAVDNIYDDQGTVRLWRGGEHSPCTWEVVPPQNHIAAPTRGNYIFGAAAHLVECMRRGRQPLLSGEQARHVLEIMLAAIESARAGRALELRTSFPYPKHWDAFEL